MREGNGLNSVPYRENKRAVEYHVAGNLELFYENIDEALEQMFGTYPPLTKEDLEPEEFADVENFIQYSAQRLAAGAVSSKVFHEQVKAGAPGKALHVYNPATASQVGHDSIHAMFAYAGSGGASLVPAYMKVDPDTVENARGISSDDSANLEEQYVAAFTQPTLFLKPICQELIGQGFSGEELAQKLIKRWDAEVAQKITSSRIHVRKPEYVSENILPEFVTFVRNYCLQMESGEVDPKFSLNEFRRILQPLLRRLRKKQEASEDEISRAQDGRAAQEQEDEQKAQEILDRIKDL